jgi:hypothetical protein
MTLAHRPSRRLQQNRRGLVLTAALVCLVVSMAIIGTMLKAALTARRQLHTERDVRQAELLLQAGFDRATSKLAADSTFDGDTWELTADEIIGRGTARITTKIQPADTSGNPVWQIHVVAEYPLSRDFPIQRSQTFAVPIAALPSKE